MTTRKNIENDKNNNVSTTGRTKNCIYKVNSRKVNPAKLPDLQTKSFKLDVNGVKIEISDSVKSVHISPAGVSISI